MFGHEGTGWPSRLRSGGKLGMCVHVSSNCGKDGSTQHVGYLPTVGRMDLPGIVGYQLRLCRHSPNWVAFTKPLINYVNLPIYLSAFSTLLYI